MKLSIRMLLCLVFILSLSAGRHAKPADERLSTIQKNLNAIYLDLEQIFHEAQARSNLVEANLTAAQNISRHNGIEIDRLIFKLKSFIEPTLEFKRQAPLNIKYLNQINQLESNIKNTLIGIGSVSKEICQKVDKWEDSGKLENKRTVILDEARSTLNEVVRNIKKIEDDFRSIEKEKSKIENFQTLMMNSLHTFNAIVQEMNDLKVSEENAKQILANEQKDIDVIPLRVKSSEFLYRNATELFKQFEDYQIEKNQKDYLSEQMELIKKFENDIQTIAKTLAEKDKAIADQLIFFKDKTNEFELIAKQISSSYINGQVEKVEESSRQAIAMTNQASLEKEEALAVLNQLRQCIGKIELVSDLVVVPELKGESYNDGLTILHRLNLTPDKKSGDPAPQKNLRGKIYEQSPEAGQKVLPGSFVTFRVYGAYVPIIPSLSDKTVEEAEALLGKSDLKGVYREGESAPSKEKEGKIYSQFPREFTPASEDVKVEAVFYGRLPEGAAEEIYSPTPFYVICRLYVPKLKQKVTDKFSLTVKDVDFVLRELPFVLLIEDRALERYSMSFFEPNKALSTFIQIIGKDTRSGTTSQYDGALLLEIVSLEHALEEVKQKAYGLLDFTEQDPFSFVKLSAGNGLFSGVGVQNDIQLSWHGGPLQSGWSPKMKERSFSLFQQLL